MVAKAEFIWTDGELVPWDDAQVHVLTHTLHYGVGAFEGIRSYRTEGGGSAVFRLDDHLERLFASAKLMMMPMPFSLEELRTACLETLRANDLSEAYLRPLAYIGTGRMGLYAFDNPTRVAIAAWKWGAYLGDEGLEKGIRATVSSWTRHHTGSTLAKGKVCGHYVNSVLAKRQAMLDGYDEAIMLDSESKVSEATGENIFVARDGVVKTPDFSSSILGGITRDAVLQIGQDLGLSMIEGTVSRDELFLADEIFMTGTAAEVTPVREIDHRVVGTGAPGPITKAVQSKFFDIVRGRCDGYERWLTSV